MSERVIKRSERTVWEFTEAEFKQLLGITDPEGVLTVSVDFSSGIVGVTLSRPDG